MPWNCGPATISNIATASGPVTTSTSRRTYCTWPSIAVRLPLSSWDHATKRPRRRAWSCIPRWTPAYLEHTCRKDALARARTASGRHPKESIMKKNRQFVFLSGILAATLLSGTANAQQGPDPRIADLAQAGKIRVGVHSVMYKTNPRTGEPEAAGVGNILLDIA